MRIAIPLIDGRISEHFGGSSHAALVEVDLATKEVRSTQRLELPPHSPGALPRFLIEQQPDVILAGSIGQRAVYMFADAGIRVVAGARGDDPQAMAQQYVAGTLALDANACQGGHDHDHSDGEHACDHDLGHDDGEHACGHDHGHDDHHNHDRQHNNHIHHQG